MPFQMTWPLHSKKHRRSSTRRLLHYQRKLQDKLQPEALLQQVYMELFGKQHRISTDLSEVSSDENNVISYAKTVTPFSIEVDTPRGGMDYQLIPKFLVHEQKEEEPEIVLDIHRRRKKKRKRDPIVVPRVSWDDFMDDFAQKVANHTMDTIFIHATSEGDIRGAVKDIVWHHLTSMPETDLKRILQFQWIEFKKQSPGRSDNLPKLKDGLSPNCVTTSWHRPMPTSSTLKTPSPIQRGCWSTLKWALEKHSQRSTPQSSS